MFCSQFNNRMPRKTKYEVENQTITANDNEKFLIMIIERTNIFQTMTFREKLFLFFADSYLFIYFFFK